MVRRRANLSLVKFRLMAFLSILGPGFITANVDNDPGGILTYSQAGAKYGYTLLWTLIPTTIALIVVQEMAARMGAVTGKGLSDLIREEFGLRATFITMAILAIADFGNIAAEFAGIASGMGVFGVSKYLAVPVGAALVWIVIVKGRYKPVERMLILFSLIYFTYPVSAFLAKPDWKLRAARYADPAIPRRFAIPADGGRPGRHHHHAVDAVLPASVDRRKGSRPPPLRAHPPGRDSGLRRHRRHRLLHRGGLRRHHLQGRRRAIGGAEINDAADAALALKPFAGQFASALFAVGLVNASLLAAAILPLATAFNICEGLGFEAGVERRFSEAPIFYWLYTLLIVGGAGFVLIPRLPLLKVILFSQVANGILLPFVLFYMLMLINRKRIMQEYVNNWWQNVVAWSTAVVMVALTAALVWNYAAYRRRATTTVISSAGGAPCVKRATSACTASMISRADRSCSDATRSASLCSPKSSSDGFTASVTPSLNSTSVSPVLHLDVDLFVLRHGKNAQDHAAARRAARSRPSRAPAPADCGPRW